MVVLRSRPRLSARRARQVRTAISLEFVSGASEPRSKSAAHSACGGWGQCSGRADALSEGEASLWGFILVSQDSKTKPPIFVLVPAKQLALTAHEGRDACADLVR